MGYRKKIAKFSGDTFLETEAVAWLEAQQRFAKAARREEKTDRPIPNETYYDRDDTGVQFAHAIEPFIHSMIELRPRIQAALASSTAETPESDVLAEILHLIEKGRPQ